jgi:CTP synthase
VISLPNSENYYNIPFELREKKVDKVIFEILNLEENSRKDPILNFETWGELVEKKQNPKKEIAVGIIGKYTDVHDAYLSILKALEHVEAHFRVKIAIKWIESTDIEDENLSFQDVFSKVEGIIVPGAFGRRGSEGKLKCIEYARKNNVPFLGLCFGMQMAVVEFARNVVGLQKAHSSELEPETKDPVIHLMESQKGLKGLGGNMRLGEYPAHLEEGSLVHGLYGCVDVVERHRHRWEVNPDYIAMLEDGGMVFSGKSPDGILMEFLELSDHIFFVATQAHPEFSSKPLNPHPLFRGFIRSIIEKK